jgi:hypothetical protein
MNSENDPVPPSPQTGFQRLTAVTSEEFVEIVVLLGRRNRSVKPPFHIRGEFVRRSRRGGPIIGKVAIVREAILTTAHVGLMAMNRGDSQGDGSCGAPAPGAQLQDNEAKTVAVVSEAPTPGISSATTDQIDCTPPSGLSSPPAVGSGFTRSSEVQTLAAQVGSIESPMTVGGAKECAPDMPVDLAVRNSVTIAEKDSGSWSSSAPVQTSGPQILAEPYQIRAASKAPPVNRSDPGNPCAGNAFGEISASLWELRYDLYLFAAVVIMIPGLIGALSAL